MEGLKQLIIEEEDWLIDRVIEYAKENDYAAYSSTLRKAWRASICGLSAPLHEALDNFSVMPKLVATHDYSKHPVAQFGIEQAKQHRMRGVTLGLFLGLMKYYRQAYVDLVIERTNNPKYISKYRRYIERFFDYVELGFCTEWSNESNNATLYEMQVKNRLLTNEKNKYLTIFESLHDPVFLLNDKGKIENFNQTARKLFVGDKDPGDKYYGEDISNTYLDQVPHLLGRGGMHFETQLKTLQGTRFFDVSIQSMLDISEKYQETILILKDISKYKEAKEQTELANKAKAAFLATMTHEIRTPINGVLGMVDLLSYTPLTEKQKRYVDSISQCSELLLNVLNDTLDYSKFEAGALGLETIDFDLQQIFRNVCDIINSKVEAHGIDLICNTGMGVSNFYYGDPARLQQILLNLIDNAVKFTSNGHVSLTIDLMEEKQPGIHLLKFNVEDTGIGINALKMDLLFKPYMQQDASTSRLYGGTGLGLAICDKLVRAMNGRIWCENNQHGGATFSFEIPLLQASKLSSRTKEPHLETIQGLNVMLVEDNNVNSEVAEGFLKRSNHKVTILSSGEEAIEYFEHYKFDLILMDVRMPGIGGVEAVKIIRQLERKSNKRTPIIFLSALADRHELETYFAAGADGFLSKPFSPDELNQTIASCLSDEAFIDHFKAISTHSDDINIIDKTCMSNHLELLGKDRAQRIYTAYCQDTSKIIKNIVSHCETAHFQEIEDAAHTLKSASRNVGMTCMAQLAEQIETAAKNQDDDQIHRKVKQLCDTRRNNLAVFQHFWEELTSSVPGAENVSHPMNS